MKILKSTVLVAALTVLAVAGIKVGTTHAVINPLQNANPPIISSITPSQGTANTLVTINGSSFVGANEVDFYDANNVLKTSIAGANLNVSPAGTSLTFTIDALTAYNFSGTFNVRVDTPNAQSNGSQFTITMPGAPVISSITGSPWTSNTVITVGGANFNSTSQIEVDSGGPQPALIIFRPTSIAADGTSLQFSLPSSFMNIIGPGTYLFSVINNLHYKSNTVTASVIPLTPTITSINPTSAQPGQAVTIYGTNFVNLWGTTVEFDNSNGQSVATANPLTSTDGTSVQFSVPTTLAPGSYEVSVINKGSTSKSNLLAFTVGMVNNPQPLTVSPASLNFTVSENAINSPSPANAQITFSNVANGAVTITKTYLSPSSDPSWGPNGWLTAGLPYLNSSLTQEIVPVSVQPWNAKGGLGIGTYTASIGITAGGQTVNVPVTLTVTAGTSLTPTISITYPTTGVVLDNGGKSNIATIQWNTQNLGNLNVEIDLQNANNYYPMGPIALNIPNTGSYVWPNNPELASGSYKISISSEDKGPSASALSGAFSIVTDVPPAPQITFIQPIAGDGYATNVGIPVYWTQSYASNSTVVQLFNESTGGSAVFTSQPITTVAQGNWYQIPASAVSVAGQYYLTICDSSVKTSGGSLCATSATFAVTGTSSVSAPTVTSVSPSSGSTGSAVTLYGTGFTSSSNVIRFNNDVAARSVSSADGSSLSFTVPFSLSPYCAAGQACPAFALLTPPGVYQVSVVNANGTSNQVPFTVNGSGSPIVPISPTPTPTSTPTTGPSTQALQAQLTQLIALLVQLLQKASAQGLISSSQLNSVLNSVSQ